jgi:uncharacterized delta-60 repeat protein
MLVLGRRRRLSMIAALIGLLALLGPAGPALAQCGPDPAFDGDGVLVTDLGSVDEWAHGVAALPDGAAIVVGESGRRITAARYLPDGTLDPAFGTGGVVQIFHDDVFSSGAHDVAVQPDGKLVLAGAAFAAVSGSSIYDIAVARLNPDGTRDTSFGGGDGVVYLDLQGRQDRAAAVAVDGAGRIVVAGHTQVVQGNSDAVVVRFLSDGSMDSSFGSQGVVVLNLRTDFDTAHALALQADGALLVAGSYQSQVMTPFLARLHGDGTRDRRFGRKGVVTPMGSGAWHDVTVQPDGRIVTAGELQADLAVARYLPNGTADGSFGAGGVATVEVDPTGFLLGRAGAVAVRADGGILAAGAAWTTNHSEMATVALTAGGAPDSRFGQGGVVRHQDPSGWMSGLEDVALRPDGSALAVGYLGYDWALARYTPCA